MTEICRNSANIRVVVYGAGAVGGVIAARLTLAGANVVLIGRAETVKTIRDQGLRLVTPVGTHVVKPLAVVDPSEVNFGPEDVLFLCVKSQDTVQAIRQLRAAVSDVPVFSFQNGIENEETVARYYPRVYGVALWLYAVFVDVGEVLSRRDPPGHMMLGRYPSGTDSLVKQVGGLLGSSGFLTKVVPDITTYKWGKLVTNLSNAVHAITNSSGDQATYVAELARREAIDILEAAGIGWVSEDRLARDWPESAVPPRLTLPTEAFGSTWQSLMRHRDTVETDFINGTIVRLASTRGTRAPVNEALVSIVQQMASRGERPGRYSPSELLEILNV